VFFLALLFSFSCRLSRRITETYAHHKVKSLVKTKLKKVILTLFTCSVRIPAAHAGKTRRKLIPGSTDWAGATHESLWPRNRVQKWGRSSPTRRFARVQIDRRAMRNRFALGHLLDRQGKREGDGYGDLCLSCTSHLPMLQIANEAR
jgi:hypothetical protein